MHITQEQLKEIDRIQRLNIVNSISGFKPANLIGTINNDGITNLAIFSSVFHLGSDPALMGFISRPHGEVPRNTYENIKENGRYTINHVHTTFIEKAHYTAAKFNSEVSEFDACKLTEMYVEGFGAPFVKESPVKIGLRYAEEIPIPRNGTIMIVGEVVHILFEDVIMDNSGHLDLAAAQVACISGLNTYYKTEKLTTFPYARVSELPDFEKNSDETP